MSRQPYSFCFLRYVHEPLSGEFANVGVLLWAPESRYLGFRASQKFQRLSQFFADFHSGDYRSMVKRIERSFDELGKRLADEGEMVFESPPQSARDLALKVVPHDDAALQWSLSSGGITDSPERELELLYHEAVGRHYDSADDERRDEVTVFRQRYSAAFDSQLVKPYIREHELVSPYVSHVFPQAWKNGVWNVYQTVSFDLKRPENIRQKSCQWESITRHLAQAEGRPRIHLLLAGPAGENRASYDKARKLLSASNLVTLVEEDEAVDFANDLKQQIQRAIEQGGILLPNV